MRRRASRKKAGSMRVPAAATPRALARSQPARPGAVPMVADAVANRRTLVEGLPRLPDFQGISMGWDPSYPVAKPRSCLRR